MRDIFFNTLPLSCHAPMITSCVVIEFWNRLI